LKTSPIRVQLPPLAEGEGAAEAQVLGEEVVVEVEAVRQADDRDVGAGGQGRSAVVALRCRGERTGETGGGVGDDDVRPGHGDGPGGGLGQDGARGAR